MKKSLLLILLTCSLCACGHTSTVPTANDTPLVLAGKSLLAVKSTIVTSATAIDGLCKANKIETSKCQQAATAYELSKPAYDSAVDAYLMMGQGYATPAEFDSALARLRAIADNMLTITGGK